MNLTDKLTDFATNPRFPFMRGFLAVGPSASSPVITKTITVDGKPVDVALNLRNPYFNPTDKNDPLNGTIPVNWAWFTAVYIHVYPAGGMETPPQDIYVLNYGQPNEEAFTRGNMSYLVNLSVLAEALKDPMPALLIDGALRTAAAAGNPIAAGFMSTFEGSGINVLLEATRVGIATLVAENVLTTDQQNALINLPLPFFV